MIVIIGTGLAGYMLAKEWRKLDATTPLVMISASRGAFYSKPLLSTALTQKKTAAELVITEVTEMAEQLNATIYSQVTVESIDVTKKTLSFSGKTLAYEKLVLACGSFPIQPILAGNAVHEIKAVNDLEAYAQFREWLDGKKQLAILGSGLVGCEFANDLLNTGHQLDIISLDQYPLQKFVCEKIGGELQQSFAEQGVRWHFNVCAERVDRKGAHFAVTLSDHTEIVAEGVMSAIGLKAQTALAVQAGLAVRQAIVVDQQLQTSDPHIYALGDCAEVAGQVKQYVAPLLQCARTLAKVLAGQNEAVHYPPMPIVIKTPAYPLVTCPVPPGIVGEWHYEGDSRHWRALFYDQAQKLRGFALTGDKVKDKFVLVKQLYTTGVC